MLSRVWPICIVLAVQVGLLAVVPARHMLARSFGTAITLKTRPLDPYDLLSGYYVTLRYEVEEAAHRELMSKENDMLDRGDRVWIIIRRDQPAWKFVSVTSERPHTGSDPDTIALPAKFEYHEVRMVGATRLYVPETQRDEAGRASRGAFVDARVGSDGTVALLRMRVGDKTYGE